MNSNLLLKMVVVSLFLSLGMATTSLYGIPFKKDPPRTPLSNLDKELKGKITDGDGSPLVGATVRVKGTNKGTLTDADGNYTLEAPDDATTLVVSYIGYAPQEIEIGGRASVNVSLEASASTLDEVVVTGYGTQKKANLTGAVSVITAEALENRPIASVGTWFAGIGS